MDLGGGTSENVALMAAYIDLSRFSKIYVVDLCASLCQQVGTVRAAGERAGGRGSCVPSASHASHTLAGRALSRPRCKRPLQPPAACPFHLQARKKVAEQGWSNVEVVEGDACRWAPPEGTAQLVTFSYSLSSACPVPAANASPALSLPWSLVGAGSRRHWRSSKHAPAPAPAPARGSPPASRACRPAAPAVIPPFHAAVDRAVSYLDRQEGLLGVCDFFSSAK